VALLKDHEQRNRLSIAARRFVDDHCGYRAASREFENACQLAIDKRTSRG
jgi:hypothetical protein